MQIGKKRRANIVSLYKDKKFPEAFAGASTFYRGLKRTSKYKKLTYQQLLKVLASVPSYSTHVRRHRLKFFRHVDYDKLSVGVHLQADLAQFPQTSGGIKYALIMVDLLDNYIYASVLPDKTALAVRKAYEDLAQKFRLQNVETIGTDQGGEFFSKNNQEFFKGLGIKLIALGRNTKAFKVKDYRNLLFYIRPRPFFRPKM